MHSRGKVTFRAAGRFGAAVVGALLSCCLAACATTVTGTAAPAPGAVSAAAVGSPADSPSPTSTPSSGTSMAGAAAKLCAGLPTGAAEQAFGLPDATVVLRDSTVLDDQTRQITCQIRSSNQFRLSVVFQLYPLSVMPSADAYAQLARTKFTDLQQVTVPNADSAGVWQTTLNGAVFDQGYVAKGLSTNVAVAVLTVFHGADSRSRLIQFMAAVVAK